MEMLKFCLRFRLFRKISIYFRIFDLMGTAQNRKSVGFRKGNADFQRCLRLSKKPCRKFKNKKLHKAGKAPSGRELDFAKQKTEGECVIQEFGIGFVCLQV
jgi:hypothetical protein